MHYQIHFTDEVQRLLSTHSPFLVEWELNSKSAWLESPYSMAMFNDKLFQCLCVHVQWEWVGSIHSCSKILSFCFVQSPWSSSQGLLHSWLFLNPSLTNLTLWKCLLPLKEVQNHHKWMISGSLILVLKISVHLCWALTLTPFPGLLDKLRTLGLPRAPSPGGGDGLLSLHEAPAWWLVKIHLLY